MKKSQLCAMFLLLSVSFVLHATEVAVAPILSIDRVDDKKDTSFFIQGDLLKELGAYDTGSVLTFSKVHETGINPPQSVKDATAVAYSGKVEYLLYGYVSKDEYTIQATINLFDANAGGNAVAFYCSDDISHYDRMMRDLAKKIVSYFDESLHLVVMQKTLPEQQSHLSVPLQVGWWTPVTSEWANLIIGTVAVNTGITFIPNDCLFIKKGNVYYLSASVDISYRYGIVNPDIQSGDLHSLGFGLPVVLHRTFNDKMEIFGGLGPLYTLEIFRNQEKYREYETHVYNDFGLIISMGYQYNLNNALHLVFDNRMEIQFYDLPMLIWSPRIGIDYTFMKEKVPEKWKRDLKQD